MTFDTAKLQVQPIREELEYGGSRLRTTAALAGARIPVVVEIGFGDAIEPGVEDIDLPMLLEMPAPHLRAYPRETVIAEKLHAMVVLGLANSRMKDYYDVWTLHRGFKIDARHAWRRPRRPATGAAGAGDALHDGAGTYADGVPGAHGSESRAPSARLGMP